MSLFLIPLLCFTAILKITLQSDFSKNGNPTLAGNVFYNGIMFASAAALFAPFVLAGGISRQTLIFGAIMGILSFAFQVFYICAFSCGEMSLTVIINNFSMILPMAVSFVMFDEDFGVPNIIGTVLALFSFALTVSPKKEEKSQPKSRRSRVKWLFFMALVFFSNGFCAVDQKIYSVRADNFQVFAFVDTAYFVAAALSLITFMLLKIKNRGENAFKCSVKYVITFCASGCVLGLFQCLNTYAASVIKGTVLYSTYNCGVSVLSVLVGRIIFKELLTRKQYAGLSLGIAAIALLCI